MYKLTYCNKSKLFQDVPTEKEVGEFCEVLISTGLYDTLVNKGKVHGLASMYTLVKLPTVDQLNSAWEDFLKVGIYDDLRFGQWFHNEYKYEVGNSYNIEHPYRAYQLLYNSLVTTLDEDEPNG